MRTINEIQYLVYPHKNINDEIVKRFYSTAIPHKIPYKNEDDLVLIVNELKDSCIDSKDVIIIKPFLGRFYQVCPGSPNMICCRYRVINTCFNCLYNCTYCYMHIYLNSYGIIQFNNTDRLFAELNNFVTTCSSSMVYRIGTGEFTDSLMMDEITNLGRQLIQFFSVHDTIFFELKTKSSSVDHLLDVQTKGNAVLAWSLNTSANIALYEHGTASLTERINAAVKAIDAGYYIAFHFDPIIMYDNWEEDYYNIIALLKQYINPQRVVWISLGGFRYHLHFREILRNKFNHEMMTTGEMFPGRDGKYRYFKPIRVKMYHFMYKHLQELFHKTYIYLCMETDDVWHQITGKYFNSAEELESDMANHLYKHFVQKKTILY